MILVSKMFHSIADHNLLYLQLVRQTDHSLCDDNHLEYRRYLHHMGGMMVYQNDWAEYYMLFMYHSFVLIMVYY